MKVLSWNMLFSNAQTERAFAFIRDTDADIICLQEVPTEFLERLRVLPYKLVSAQEIERIYHSVRSIQHLVILSRYRIHTHKTLQLPYRATPDPFRTKAFVFFMSTLGFWAQGEGERHALIADIETPNGLVRVFNVHLPLNRFAWRREEFELALNERDATLPTIVCGDFNTLESRRIAILSWLLGGPFSESVLWRRERADMEARFATHALTNALHSKVTHALSKSQLDHILLSKHFTLSQAIVREDSVGSDHRPICVLIGFAAIPREHKKHEPERCCER